MNLPITIGKAERKKIAQDKYRKSHPDKVAAAKKRHYEKHKEKINENSRLWRKNNPDQRSASYKSWLESKTQEELKELYLKGNLARFGITIEEYRAKLEEQEYRCKICNIHQSEIGENKRLVIDHCHETNKIRGLLCPTCNLGLGHFRDSIDTLQSAINYLKNLS